MLISITSINISSNANDRIRLIDPSNALNLSSKLSINSPVTMAPTFVIMIEIISLLRFPSHVLPS